MDFSSFLDAGFGVMDKWAAKKWSNDNQAEEAPAPVVIQQQTGTSTWTWVALTAASVVLFIVVLKK